MYQSSQESSAFRRGECQFWVNGAIINDVPVGLDLSRPINGYWNVIQYAIVSAIYMGFKEIYLLGCDGTSIMTFLNSALNLPLTDEHLYEEKVDAIKLHNSLGGSGPVPGMSKMTHMFFGTYCMFLGYDKLNYICQNILKVRLANCTVPSTIVNLPHMDLNDVLNEKR